MIEKLQRARSYAQSTIGARFSCAIADKVDSGRYPVLKGRRRWMPGSFDGHRNWDSNCAATTIFIRGIGEMVSKN